MGGSTPTIGYKYHLGVHIGVCVGPVDEVRAIYFDDKEGWRGSVTADASIDIIKPNLFGGEKKEGGVAGTIDVMMGTGTQTQNAYLLRKIGANVPAYRGILSMVFRGRAPLAGSAGALLYATLSRMQAVALPFYWSAMNPYIKPVGVEVKRILSGWDGGVWYSAKAAIGDNMNPAHIIYQCITDPTWGSGLSSALLDDTSFRSAADTLYAEGFGLSFKWVQQQPVEAFIAEVIRHIDGALYFDRSLGKFVLSLNRFNYVPSSLPLYSTDQIVEMEEFKRAAWGETTNELVVTYTDAATEEDATISVHNLSNIQKQGGIVSASRNYAGIRSADLAYRVAQRDLRVVSTPLAAVTFTVNRSAWQVNPGGVFRLSWPDHGLVDVVFRAVEVDYGTLSNGTIRVQAVEDVFAMPSNTYGSGQGSGWVDPTGAPATISVTRTVEANYVDATTNLGAEEVSGLATNAAFPLVLAEKPNQVNSVMVAYVSPDTNIDNYVQTNEGIYTPTVVSPSAADRSQTTVSYAFPKDFDVDGALGVTAYWDDEIIYIESVNATTQVLTIKRGIIDSVPQTHGINSKIWVHDQQMGVFVGDAGLVSGATAYLKPVGASTSQQSALASAPVATFVGSARWNKPWPPANVKVNDSYFPAQISSNFTITWAGRNRTQQDVDYVGWYEGHIQPESGTTYTLEVYNADTNALIRAITGLTTTSTGGSYSYPGDTSGAVRLRLKLFAVRNGVASHVAWEHTADLGGYGIAYDENYGGGTLGVVLAPSTTIVIPDEQYTPIPSPVWINGAWRDLTSGTFWTSSDNGVSWIAEARGPSNPFSDEGWIVYGNGNYVRNSRSSKIRVRKDGGVWQEVDITSLPNAAVSGGKADSVIFDGSQFVMLKNGGTDIYTCANPSTDQWAHVGAPSTNNQLFSRFTAVFLTKVGSNYVAIGSKNGTTYVSTSTDLISWTVEAAVPAAVYSFQFIGAYFNGYYWCHTGNFASTVPVRLLRSTDMVTWTEIDVGAQDGMNDGYFVVLQSSLFFVSADFVVSTSNGTAFSVDRSHMNLNKQFVRAKHPAWSTEAAPNRAVLYQPMPKEKGGKLVYANSLTVNWSSVNLLFPNDALNTKDIGVLGSAGYAVLDDSGFLISDSGITTAAALIARNAGRRYFEVKLVSKNVSYTQQQSASPILMVGAAAFGKAGDGNTSYVAINSLGSFIVSAAGATAAPVSSYVFTVGQVFGFEIDFSNRIASIYVDNVLFATVSNIDVTQRWVPMLGAYGCTLELNIGQKTFTYSRPGTTPWRS